MNDNDYNVPLEPETKERLTFAMKHLTNQGLSELIDIINEDCFWIHDYAPVRYDLQYDWLSDYVWMDYGGGYRQFLTLDIKKRQEKMNH